MATLTLKFTDGLSIENSIPVSSKIEIPKNDNLKLEEISILGLNIDTPTPFLSIEDRYGQKLAFTAEMIPQSLGAVYTLAEPIKPDEITMNFDTTVPITDRLILASKIGSRVISRLHLEME